MNKKRFFCFIVIILLSSMILFCLSSYAMTEFDFDNFSNLWRSDSITEFGNLWKLDNLNIR